MRYFSLNTLAVSQFPNRFHSFRTVERTEAVNEKADGADGLADQTVLAGGGEMPNVQVTTADVGVLRGNVDGMIELYGSTTVVDICRVTHAVAVRGGGWFMLSHVTKVVCVSNNHKMFTRQ